MSVRKAVERVQTTSSTAAPSKVDTAVVVRQAIETQSAAFRAVLPTHVDPERFARLVLTAVKSTPDLMQCFATTRGKTSVLLAAMQSAAVGLEPNTPTQEAWLLPRKIRGRDGDYAWECQLSIGYRGYQKLARRSGTIKTIYAEAVRLNDDFRWERGLEDDVLEFRPFDGSDDDRGELTHAFAVVRYLAGGYNYIVLNRHQVHARRAMSDSWRSDERNKTAYSPWTKWPEAMWRKSAVRALVPYLDLTPQAAEALDGDERRLSFDEEAGVIDVAEAFGELDAPDELEPANGEAIETTAKEQPRLGQFEAQAEDFATKAEATP